MSFSVSVDFSVQSIKLANIAISFCFHCTNAHSNRTTEQRSARTRYRGSPADRLNRIDRSTRRLNGTFVSRFVAKSHSPGDGSGQSKEAQKHRYNLSRTNFQAGHDAMQAEDQIHRGVYAGIPSASQMMPSPVPSPRNRSNENCWFRFKHLMVSLNRRFGSKSSVPGKGSSIRDGQDSS